MKKGVILVMWIWHVIFSFSLFLFSKRNKYPISPITIITAPKIVLLRIKEMNTRLLKFMIIKQILLVSTLGNI